MKTYNRSNLDSHLKYKHCQEFAEFEKLKPGERHEQKPINSAKARQLMLKESNEQTQRWNMNDVPAHHVHHLIEQRCCYLIKNTFAFNGRSYMYNYSTK